MSDSDGKKTLGVRGGGSRSGQVKQSFSHGRTKSVVVETKRKRVVVPKPGSGKSGGGAAGGDPSRRPAGISDAEMERRLKALQAAKAREAEETAARAAEEKARAEERERRRAEAEAKEREEREREEKAKAKAEEEERLRKEAEEAKKNGMEYRHIPMTSGTLSIGASKEFAKALAELPKPILAHCAGATRSATLWSLAQAAGGMDAEEILKVTGDAGFDLSAHGPLMRGLKEDGEKGR